MASAAIEVTGLSAELCEPGGQSFSSLSVSPGYGSDEYLNKRMLSRFQCFQKVCKPTQIRYEQENDDMRDKNQKTEVQMGENCD